ncbi:MAG TPA: response regulator transcription factor [Candidatus Synoicihabitans sp.]|nr:response regulator transcription factor [Candidatus Synoicihabitans sp.]
MMTAVQPIRVLLVDDSTLVREGIRSVFAEPRTESGIEVVGEAGSVAEAVKQATALKPDVVLLDIRLPDGSGFTACREMLKQQPGLRVLVLTSFTNDGFIYEAITSGAQGYLMKEIDPQGLIQAIHDIVAGKSILSPDITAGVMRMVRGGSSRSEPGDLSSLSKQERRVLALVAEGKTNKQIADDLGLSDNTVKNYLCNVFEKLQVRRRSQAAAMYVQAHPPGN